MAADPLYTVPASENFAGFSFTGSTASEAAFISNAKISGKTINVALTLEGDCVHDHNANVVHDLRKPTDTVSYTLTDYLSSLDQANRVALATPGGTPPDFNTIAGDFLSKSNMPTATIHQYFINHVPYRFNNSDYQPAKLLATTTGRDLSSFNTILSDHGVTRGLVDSYNYNPYTKGRLGASLGDGFQNLKTITTRTDAAPKLTEVGFIKNDVSYHTEPFIVHFYNGVSYLYRVIKVGTKEYNTITILDENSPDHVIFLRCESGISVNAISAVLNIPLPRVKTTEEGVAITKHTVPISIFIGTLAADGNYHYVQHDGSTLTGIQKAKIMLVKQVTDFGQFYQATYLTNVSSISKKTVLVTIDKYFKEIMENRSRYMNPGFVIVMDRNENQLWCLNDSQLTSGAGKANILANLAAHNSTDPTSSTLLSSYGLPSSSTDSILPGKFATLFSIPELYTNAFVYPFYYNIFQTIQNLYNYTSNITAIITTLAGMDPTTVDLNTIDTTGITRSLASLTVDKAAASIFDKLQNIIGNYYKLYSDCKEIIGSINVSTPVDERLKKNEEIAELIYRFYIDPINFEYAGDRVDVSVISMEDRLKLVGYVLSYIITDTTPAKTIPAAGGTPAYFLPSVYGHIYNKLTLLEGTSNISAKAFYGALKTHWRSSSIAGNRRIAIINFQPVTAISANPVLSPLLKPLTFLDRVKDFTLQLNAPAGTPSTISSIVLDDSLKGSPAYSIANEPVPATQKISMIDNNPDHIISIAALYNTIVPDKKIYRTYIKKVADIFPQAPDDAAAAPAVEADVAAKAAVELTFAREDVRAEIEEKEKAAEKAAKIAKNAEEAKKSETTGTLSIEIYDLSTGNKGISDRLKHNLAVIDTYRAATDPKLRSYLKQLKEQALKVNNIIKGNYGSTAAFNIARTPSKLSGLIPKLPTGSKVPSSIKVIKQRGGATTDTFPETGAIIFNPKPEDLSSAMKELIENTKNIPCAPLDQASYIEALIEEKAPTVTTIIDFMNLILTILDVIKIPAYEMGQIAVEQFDEIYRSTVNLYISFINYFEDNDNNLVSFEILTAVHFAGLILDGLFISPFFTDGLRPQTVVTLINLLMNCLTLETYLTFKDSSKEDVTRILVGLQQLSRKGGGKTDPDLDDKISAVYNFIRNNYPPSPVPAAATAPVRSGPGYGGRPMTVGNISSNAKKEYEGLLKMYPPEKYGSSSDSGRDSKLPQRVAVKKRGGSRRRRSTKSRRHLRRTRRRADAAKARRKQTRRFR